MFYVGGKIQKHYKHFLNEKQWSAVYNLIFKSCYGDSSSTELPSDKVSGRCWDTSKKNKLRL